MRTKEQLKAYHKLWREKNKEAQAEKRRLYYLTHKKEIEAYNFKNREYILERQATYRRKNKKRILSNTRKWKAANKEKVMATQRAWMTENSLHMRTYRKRRYRNNIQVNLAKRLREKIRHAIKKWGQTNHASKADYLMGCKPSEFLRHIKAQFKPGMTWDNIHIDHIKPVCSFDLTIVEEQKKCFHYSNCQPLFPEENAQKRNASDSKFFKRKPPPTEG